MLVAQNSLGPVCPVPLTVRGKLGLPKDPARARFWLQKVANDECKSGIYPSGPAEAAEYLRELDNA